MKRFTFGEPEKLVPSAFCDGFSYREGPCRFSEDDFTFRLVNSGCLVEFDLEPGARVYGFGLQLKSFDHTGKKLALRCNADPLTPCGDSHAPVPFFVTNKGYGMYFDTARNAEFYCGVKRPDGKSGDGTHVPSLSEKELYAPKLDGERRIMSVFVPNCRGVELYVIEGKTAGEVVSRYNMMAGGGCDVPEWALGVLYRCNGRHTDKQVTETAEYFRENDIPCDIIGLEPGWMTRSYSCTYVWNGERFPDPEGFMAKMESLGYRVNVWQHAFVHPDCPIYEDLLPYSGDYAVFNGLVPDFALPEARNIYADFQRKNLTSIGVTGFKADECDGSDNTGGWSFPNHARFPSGLTGEQYHNLFGLLYAKTMWEALDFAPTLSEVRSMGALAAKYPFVLYSDLYDLRDFVRGVVVSGFSGLLWAPELRHAKSKKELLRRLQAVVFSVHCLINAWNCPQIPWLEYDAVDEVRELLRTRERLIPRLKKAFDRYRDEGVPPTRALVMDYTDDANVYDIDDEYMLGDDLLVAPITSFDSDEREVYLPEGRWTDFYTGEEVKSGRLSVKTENIPVFVKG